MLNWEINSDIRYAETIPTDFYLSEEYFQLSKEKIFGTSWLLAAHDSQLKTNNQLLPVHLLEGYLNEPILFSKNENGLVTCLSNVCTHRGNILIDSPCKQSNIRCKYHGRRFELDGTFEFMPEFKECANFPTEKDNLHKINFAEFKGFYFTNLKPFYSFDEAIADIQKRIGWIPVEIFKEEPTLSRDYLVKANWALYVENYLEGFHIPFVHADLNQSLDYGNYTTEIYKYANLQLGIGKSGEFCFDLPESSPDFGKKIAAYYYWIFPNTMLNFYPWGLSVNIIKPLEKNLTKVSFITYIWDSSKLDKGAGAMLDKVEREDEEIVEMVQKGIKSSFYKRGRYSPTREQGTHHFHRLITDFLNK